MPQREEAEAANRAKDDFLATVSHELRTPLKRNMRFILDHVHWLGISSWRWLLILEGLPAVACVSPSSSSHQSNLQFRAEAFNVLNRANLCIPNLVMLTASGTPASSAGAITTTATTSRQIQLGLKLSW